MYIYIYIYILCICLYKCVVKQLMQRLVHSLTVLKYFLGLLCMPMLSSWDHQLSFNAMLIQDGSLKLEPGKKKKKKKNYIDLMAIHGTQIQSDEIWSFMCCINTGDISMQLQHSQPYLENFF